jgi:hypothetical protein
MSTSDQYDCCPNCRAGFEIVCVKFGFAGTASVWRCQNCAIMFSDERLVTITCLQSAPKWVKRMPVLQTALTMMDFLNSRFRHLITLLVAAVVTAAVLRHVVHIYGGIAPDDIRWDALVVLAFVVVVLLAFVAKRSRGRQG